MPQLALGTVQFGLDYGITNTRGRLTTADIQDILTVCHNQGIDVLDTAAAYGNAEEILGQFHAADRFRVITKIGPSSATDVAGLVEQSCTNLGVTRLDSVLLHDASVLERDPQVWSALYAEVTAGRVRNVGISVYWPRQLEMAKDVCRGLRLPLPNVVQLPMSIFDQRFVSCLPSLVADGTEVHVRSVFLQGLGFMGSDALPDNLQGASSALSALQRLCDSYSISRAEALLAFVAGMPGVSRVVVGVDSPLRLAETIAAYTRAQQIAADLTEDPSRPFDIFRIEDESVILPFNWR
ncbi:MAG: aldo/keto reductase [Spirochaeta sp.]|jgi:aryl-alcohol dehydrogenase-like predicted oxidoreductase|nr:aldo/keto reductase [Spirochaeta sp.]